jgi:hypothetical protein
MHVTFSFAIVSKSNDGNVEMPEEDNRREDDAAVGEGGTTGDPRDKGLTTDDNNGVDGIADDDVPLLSVHCIVIRRPVITDFIRKNIRTIVLLCTQFQSIVMILFYNGDKPFGKKCA